MTLDTTLAPAVVDAEVGSSRIDLAVRGLLPQPDGSWAVGEVLVRDGVIVAVTAPHTVPATRTIDAGSSYLVPGMVDAHVHSLSHDGEGIAAATRAAAAGGVTTIVEMPFDLAGPISTVDRFSRKAELAEREAHIDVALLGTALPGGGWRNIEALAAVGAAGFKVSTFHTDTQRFPRVHDGELLDVFSAAADNGMPVCVHAENNDIIKHLIERYRPEGDDPLAHIRSRPEVSETLGVLTVLEIGRAAGAKIHMCHTSLPRSVSLVRSWAEDGMDVTMETCPHYLLLDESDMKEQGTRLKINPPLRTASAREGLWAQIENGMVDVISSDHAPWPVEFKNHRNVFDNHSGAPGVQTIYPLVLAEALRRSPKTFRAAIEAMTINPARRYGLDKRKGAIAPGYDADIVAFDGNAVWKVDLADLQSNAGWSPYEGFEVPGRVTLTLSRGRVVFDGELRSEPGSGSVLAPAHTS
ncbi:dihydroorotase [Subtercola frigoramans]|uniref:Allantoinase n=1 Tax=Subtercola frigoramans TaxID=120298 RepID=A0ABS2L8N3_9MICO|nr:dihydroorotase family protein [Subtercola frigoramans]MBM7473460.1 allantoinase [Subtercola frigoramans]